MKRFTETTKWADPWFMDLPVKYKTFWSYILDQCDCAGTWEPNMRLAVAQIGEPFELTEILRIFTDRIRQLPDGKLWVVKFIEFQYGILSPSCKPHIPVLKRLENLGLAQESLRVSIPLRKSIQRPQEKEKEKNSSTLSKAKPQNQQEVENFCASLGLPPSDGEAMWLDWQERGYGKTKDWKAKIRKWKLCGYMPSQKPQRSFGFQQAKRPDPNQERIDEEYERHLQEMAKKKSLRP